MEKNNILELIKKASEAKIQAYAPYSKFNVGCAIMLKNKSYLCGANIENASFPVGICAERVAFSQVIFKNLVTQVQALAIFADSITPITPCGVCLQFLFEFATLKLPIITGTPQGETRKYELGELLPHGFGPKNLKVMKSC